MRNICIPLLLGVFVTLTTAVPVPQDDAAAADPPAEGDAAAAPAEGAPAEGDAPAADGAAPAEGAAADGAAKEGGDAAAAGGEAAGGAAEGETTVAGEAGGDEAENEGGAGGNTTAKTIKLMIGSQEEAPPNIIMDHYGNPKVVYETFNFTIPGGEELAVISEMWQTHHTKPATIPGCLCVSRAPLPRLKLYGNLHFPFIKVTPAKYVTIATDPPTTLCPPCDCTNCDNQIPPE